jgi:dynein heavy chain
VITDSKKVETTDQCNALFLDRVRAFLHISLCMSPVGDALRVRCRKFPSLVNCCTLDWFSSWPPEALLFVSRAFLKQLELPSDEVRESLAQMCMTIHTSVEEASEKFWNELRRRVYTTPKSYLDLIALYINMLAVKRKEININRSRLSNGLTTLKNTNASIADLKVNITKMLPELAKANEELAVTLKQVDKDKAIADEKDRVVSAEKEIVEKSAAEAKVVKDEADSDLAQAMPMLEQAQKIVASLDKGAVVEIKALGTPPPAVEMVMEAVVLMLGETKISWDHIRQVIKEPAAFLKRVQSLDVATISETVLKKVREKYFKREGFVPDQVSNKSVPAGKLCGWALALSKYQLVNKNIIPKKEKAAEMDKLLSEQTAILNKKLEELRIVKEKVQVLIDNSNRLKAQKDELEFRMNRDQARMGRANKLVVLLADEAIRWKETVEVLDDEIH